MSDLTKKLYELSQEDLDRISGGLSLEEILKEFGDNLSQSESAFLARYIEPIQQGKPMYEVMEIFKQEFPDFQ